MNDTQKAGGDGDTQETEVDEHYTRSSDENKTEK